MGIRAQLLACSLALAFMVGGAGNADAASYKRLKSKGYKTGKMIKNRAGIRGWMVSGEGKKYFCKLRSATFYVGKSGMVVYTSAGRGIKLDRKTYDKLRGGPDPSIPQLADAKAGRIKPNHVGRCRKI